MKQNQWIAALAAVGLLALALPVHGQVGADGVKAQSLSGQRLVGVKSDSVQKVVGADGSGSGLNVTDTDRDRDYGQILATGIDALTLAAGQTARSGTECIDLSTYSHATLMLTWSNPAADSVEVSFGVTVFNKATSAWSTDDSPVMIPRWPSMVSAAGADTTAPAILLTTSNLPMPTFYVYRDIAAPSTYALSALARVPNVRTNVSGVAINLTELCGGMQFNYFGFQIHNVHAATSLTNLKAVLWVSR